jgi:hypothetical protein
MIKIFEEFKEHRPKFPVGSYVKFSRFDVVHDGSIFKVKEIISNGIFNAPNIFKYNLECVYTTRFDKIGNEVKWIIESILEKVEEWEITAKQYNL